VFYSNNHKSFIIIFIQIVLCSAVGFDSYVIIRHGVRTEESNSSSTTYKNLLSGDKLGCYFCNDVVAPGDVCIEDNIPFIQIIRLEFY
jgi:hypothetical protein